MNEFGTPYIPNIQNGLSQDYPSRIARMEVHLHHLSQRCHEERMARLALRTEMLAHVRRLDRKDADQDRVREALIQWAGYRAIIILVFLIATLASIAFDITIPNLEFDF